MIGRAINVLERIDGPAGKEFELVGESLRQAGERLLLSAGKASGVLTEASEAMPSMAMVDNAIMLRAGREIALLPGQKAVLKLNEGAPELYDLNKAPEYERTWYVYKAAAQGRPFLHSVGALTETSQGEFLIQRPLAMDKLANLRGVDDGFINHWLAGTKPYGMGQDRLAFLTDAREIRLFGVSGFRKPVPDLLFPKTRGVNAHAQVETLELAHLATDDDVVSVAQSLFRSGWVFTDAHPGQVGRLDDGTLKLLDAGSPVRIEVRDKLAAAESYRNAIIDGTARYGAESHPVGGFHSELGMYHMQLGNMQSAEEHLRIGSRLLLKHEDWGSVERTADRQIELYKRLNNASMAREAESMSLKSIEMQLRPTV